ncbi:MAG TPA: dihydropyrimidinase [Steroidobacteraceae bacterium]|nr:dihydropyrimidinase [Steroidobacteraceae bacterium]
MRATAEFDLVIRGGTLATAADVFNADIGVRDGKIVAIGARLAGGSDEIDARDKYVLPGGVDAHCHLDQPSSDGSVCADDFRSGTIAAACGGTTTVIPFAAQAKGQSVRAAVEDYHRRADNKAVIDYAFHLIVSDPGEQVLREELPALIRAGYSSFKIYMTYEDLKLSDRQALEVLAVARRERALVMVHAENSDVIGWLTDQLEAAGQTEPRYHALSRPVVAEREATHRAISLSQIVGVPILIVHVSARDAAEQIQWAQRRGLPIYAETCPQYLFLTEGDLARPGFEGAKCLCSPPPRDRHHQEALWLGLRTGVFQVFSSDHAPTRFNDPKGKMLHGSQASFRYVPNGVPGIETRLPLLFSAGVVGGRLDLTRFVALTASNPARIYGLYPRKGTLAIGADADIVVWDPTQTRVIRNEHLHHAVDFTPYEGMRATGWPVITISRGDVVYRDNEVLGRPGRGVFLPCGTPEPASRFADQITA